MPKTKQGPSCSTKNDVHVIKLCLCKSRPLLCALLLQFMWMCVIATIPYLFYSGSKFNMLQNTAANWYTSGLFLWIQNTEAFILYFQVRSKLIYITVLEVECCNSAYQYSCVCVCSRMRVYGDKSRVKWRVTFPINLFACKGSLRRLHQLSSLWCVSFLPYVSHSINENGINKFQMSEEFDGKFDFNMHN